ncbi:heavy metal translocating P-type ATPase [Oceanidesulfovibrio marinus]|uniref:P-type Zn(2+) transporter n=1 Tax=Oceanidesulfovibrio marinus TaxID=370038 RepID=A0A6P1ZMR0_9BACT|nr:cation-translocating P-type ATPase [Oceanidesulfovibrio marinus]TVM36574.1 cation-transporting P-type ATPase [Oceanidesulfovibrio marinus]
MTLSQRTDLRIVHAIPGRVRIKSPLLRQSSATLSEALQREEFVHWARQNTVCSSLIVRFDSGVDTAAVMRLVASILGVSYKPASSLRSPAVCPHGVCSPAAPCRCAAPPENNVTVAAMRFGGLTLAMGWILARRIVTGAMTQAGLFSPLGAVAIVGALPLLRGLAKDARQRKVRLESFLAGSIVAAIAAGEVVTALEVLWITAGGDLLKTWITERSRRAVAEILEVTTHHTFVLRDGVEVETHVDQLVPGDIVVAHTGEKIAVDGKVTRGHALVDESTLTGNAEFPERKKGDRVFAGTMVRQGVLYIEAGCVGDNTYLARILHMIEEGLANRAPIEGMADQLAQRTVRIGGVVTLGTLLVTGNLMRAFTVLLVMACPCATVLAASTAVSAAISTAARNGVLIKGGRYLEQIGDVDVVCFDKTGTLTTTSPRVEALISQDGASREELLQLAYSAEIHNHHPLAEAIKVAADAAWVTPTPHDVCEYFLGQGVRSVVEGRTILIGNAKLMKRFKVKLAEVNAQAESISARGLTTLFLAKDREVLGMFGIANPLRDEAVDVARKLHSQDVTLCLVTGDEARTVADLSERLGIAKTYSSILPDGKSAVVEELQSEGKLVAMVGDGVNDALALAVADVGVAMSAGASEAAMEAADIALIRDDLSQLTYIRDLSRKTTAIARQNFWIATGTNIIGAVGGIVGAINPLMAGMLHIVHTMGVIGNSSRLLAYDHTPDKN